MAINLKQSSSHPTVKTYAANYTFHQIDRWRQHVMVFDASIPNRIYIHHRPSIILIWICLKKIFFRSIWMIPDKVLMIEHIMRLAFRIGKTPLFRIECHCTGFESRVTFYHWNKLCIRFSKWIKKTFLQKERKNISTIYCHGKWNSIFFVEFCFNIENKLLWRRIICNE